MGLLNKIKNVLFEEEEIEIPASEPIKKEKIEEPKPIEKRRSVVFEEKESEPLLKERDLFKAEKTFDFPVFDDEEFEEMKDSKQDNKENMSINLFDYENPKKKEVPRITKAPEIKGRAYDTKKSDFDSRKFRPSPVISPVYGVLDKNYKKEDIVVAKPLPKQIDVDDVRKKAFGTLEDDIEKSLNVPVKDTPVMKKKEVEEEKSIDDLLEETSFATIELPDFKEEETFLEEPNTDIEEDIVIQNDEELELAVLDQQTEKSEQEKIEDDDTLESDLFDLIDSMYENREDE